jgi:Flp pilus assembly protein TadD
VALKNLGAILGKEGDSLRALYFLRRSFEIDLLDPQTVYGLAFAYMELGDMEPAQKHFQAVLETSLTTPNMIWIQQPKPANKAAQSGTP